MPLSAPSSRPDHFVFNLADLNLEIVFLSKHNHSGARAFHTAWTPPSLPDSILLMGGKSDASFSELTTAETVPGTEAKATAYYHY